MFVRLFIAMAAPVLVCLAVLAKRQDRSIRLTVWGTIAAVPSVKEHDVAFARAS